MEFAIRPSLNRRGAALCGQRDVHKDSEGATDMPSKLSSSERTSALALPTSMDRCNAYAGVEPFAHTECDTIFTLFMQRFIRYMFGHAYCMNSIA